jgi:AraC-like DNA-binding protein
MPTYREHAPHPALARHVECYWSIRASIDPAYPVTDRVLPDGCMDIIFGLSPSASMMDLAPYAVGTMTRPLDVTYSGSVDLFAVRFRPGAARAFLETEAYELTDRIAPLGDLWGRPGEELGERVASATTAGGRVDVMDSALRARLRPGAAADARVLAATELVAARHGAARVDAMARTAGMSRRQLERHFLASVGVTPKMACRVARFRRAVVLMHGRPAATLSQVAAGAGYADQPHFTRDFRALAGVTPGAYLRARSSA